MTSAINRSRGTPPASRHALDPEERFQRRVKLGFAALIVVVLAIVAIGLVYVYWDQHFRPVATVNGAAITRDQWLDRARLEDVRLEHRERDVRAALAAGEVTEQQAADQLAAISSERSAVTSSAIDNLVDLTFKGQLADQQGVSVTDEDVQASVTADASPPEGRRIEVIFVEPGANTDSESTAGNTPRQDRQAAFKAAQDASAALAAGTPFADVAREYSTDASSDQGGAFGLITRANSELDPPFIEALFALEQGGVTSVIEGDDGIYRIGRVAEIITGSPDPGFETDVRDRLSWDTYLAAVRQETVAKALEDKVVADATADAEQARLSEIFLEGDPTLTPEEDTGQIRASHILYSPGDDPQTAGDLPDDDPAWAAAQQQAEAAAAQLRSISDVDDRMTAFAERARNDSDDTVSGAQGGDLGFFDRNTMVDEFASAVFDAEDPQRGDIIGPVKSSFGWHVIQYVDRLPPLHERLTAVQDALAAEGADFAAIAQEQSDGAEGAVGGELGWRTRGQLEQAAADAVFALEPGAVSEPIALDDGQHIYRLEEKAASRPLDPAQLASVRATAFGDWYEPQLNAAEDAGQITRDESVFSTDVPSVG
jgi:parvulin-like peptidyl-prolyl isomerase